MVVLKRFQNNLFHMLHSLARISRDTGILLGIKGCFFPFITNLLTEAANQALICRDDFYYFQLHLFEYFWMLKTQNTEYN